MNTDQIVNAALENAQRIAAQKAKATKPVLSLKVVGFKPLSSFTVESRPLNSDKRVGGWRPAAMWFHNPKLRHAAETVQPGDHTRYVEDGETNFKVRLKA